MAKQNATGQKAKQAQWVCSLPRLVFLLQTQIKCQYKCLWRGMMCSQWLLSLTPQALAATELSLYPVIHRHCEPVEFQLHKKMIYRTFYLRFTEEIYSWTSLCLWRHATQQRSLHTHAHPHTLHPHSSTYTHTHIHTHTHTHAYAHHLCGVQSYSVAMVMLKHIHI